MLTRFPEGDVSQHSLVLLRPETASARSVETHMFLEGEGTPGVVVMGIIIQGGGEESEMACGWRGGGGVYQRPPGYF